MTLIEIAAKAFDEATRDGYWSTVDRMRAAVEALAPKEIPDDLLHRAGIPHQRREQVWKEFQDIISAVANEVTP